MHIRKCFGWSLIIALLVPAAVSAQTERERGWDAGFHIVSNASLTMSGLAGAAMQVESNLGYGFSGAYNFSDRVALGIDASWRSPRYRAEFVPDGPGPVRVIHTRMDVARIHLKGIFYFLESNVTPYAEVGFGWTRIDSNILEGPPITGCWWDPWWGFVCQNFYSTYSDTKSSSGASFGVRWDTRTEVALRASVGTLRIDRARGVDNSNVDTAQIEVLWRF